jgi:organic hydroperoxide reductase OsmC/OhrA
MHPFPHRYVVSSTVTPEDPVVIASPGTPSLPTVTPPEFGGPGGLWSPETLLVGAVADCFAITFRGIARAQKMPWLSARVTCEGRLERPDRVTQFTRFDLHATLVLPPGVAREQAERVLARAEETCLVTRSLKGETHLRVTIEQDECVASGAEVA